MASLKTAFTHSAGDDVTFLRCNLKGRDMEIIYAISGQGKEEFRSTMRLMNTSDAEIAAKAAVAGNLAGQRAFHATGKYDAQFKSLSNGKLAK